ncbi:DNA-directed RNA polymerase III subunit RPC6 [Quillaja saponaria]|uniref:DNA-directed RNA polymerase III subunit RPC6 n=1 Tax=Quillaja saponaria TaxID=32244 RepID=A0AAD7M373_QUISA|nr:DNA-directed RNA polymerase III subunit RPC6 [Quillaja saponaria]
MIGGFAEIGMRRLQGPSSLKRKQPDSGSPSDSLTDAERILYNLIRGKQDMGIWSRDMKRETNLPDQIVNKSLKSLLAKQLIKEVVNIQKKGSKHYMATEFEPSKEITGGEWYADGSLDVAFISILKDQCLKYISKKVATADEILDWMKKSRMFSVDLTTKQIEQILRALVLDNDIMEIKSTGYGDFSSVKEGRVCYKCTKKDSRRGEPNAGAMASIPCGVCPRISHCTPDGIISPTTCVYYTKWLDF